MATKTTESPKQSKDSRKSTKPSTTKKIQYIPPHLRGKGIITLASVSNEQSPANSGGKIQRKIHSPERKCNDNERQIQDKAIKKLESKNNGKIATKWYESEHKFECALGCSLKSFKLNVPSYRNENELNALTNIKDAKCNESDPSILFVIGPPAVGKSTFYQDYLLDFGIDSAVNTDGDIVRKSHYGIQKYLQQCKKLNIGYSHFFRDHVQKWTKKWKMEIRQIAMKDTKHIIAFSTCHRSNEFIEECERLIESGYWIKILMICAEFDTVKEMGRKREECDGRKFVDGTYMRAMQGCIDVIDYLVRNERINEREDLIIVQNEYEKDKQPARLRDNWRNVKNRVLVPMKKRAQRKMYKK